MSDRFDLETKIMSAWSTKEDLELAFRNFYDGPREYTQDEIANTLLGIASLHEMRMEELWDAFTGTFKLDKYADPN
jgi:hypothetical protein